MIIGNIIGNDTLATLLALPDTPIAFFLAVLFVVN